MTSLNEILNEKKFEKPEKIKNFDVKTYENPDYKGLIKLYKTVFPNLVLDNFIQWKNKKNPFGDGDNFTLLMMDDENIIAQYTVVPKHFYIYGEKFLCVQSIGTMTHPNYQGLGISTYLAELLYEYAKKEGYYFVYGFPNKNSIYLFEKKLNWINFGRLDLFLKEITLKKNKAFNQNNFKVEEIFRFDYKINDLWTRVKNNFSITIKKNMKYLNWRFIEHPSVNYRVFLINDKDSDLITSYFVLKKFKNENGELTGHIVDFLIEPSNKNFEREIFEIIEAFSLNYFRVDCSKISFWLPNENLINFAFNKLGYKSLKMDTYFGFRNFLTENNFQILKNPKNWGITMAYSDVF